jgi:hypothetical protein
MAEVATGDSLPLVIIFHEECDLRVRMWSRPAISPISRSRNNSFRVGRSNSRDKRDDPIKVHIGDLIKVSLRQVLFVAHEVRVDRLTIQVM